MHINHTPAERIEVDWAGTKVPMVDITTGEIIRNRQKPSGDWSKRGKRLEKYVRVSIVIELVTVGTKLEDL